MFPFNIDPQLYALSATLVGAAIAPSMDSLESVSIGNWLVLLGDYLIAYSGQLALINNKQNNQNQNIDINTILNTLEKIENELEKLKKEGKI
ncbi:hypothetical protein EGP91_02975 [bacterium]|nr:hypothetical protein [bacterium]